ncbi:MAG: DUF4340 domain-containing protein [bacterium]
MRIRTFIVLILALALLGGLIVLNKRKKESELATPSPSVEMLLPPERLNDITRFTVTVGTQVTAVARSGERWVVESLWNYPANFDVVADNLRKLADVKGGEVIHEGTERLEEFGLAQTTNANILPPATLVFYDAGGRPLREIGMGSPRMPKSTGGRPQFPESAFVLLDNREVRLVAAYMPGIPRSSEGWIDRSVVSVPAEDVDEISVTLTNGVSYRVTRNVDGTFTSDSLQETETMDQDGAGTLAEALSQLNLSTIADPATTADACGLDKPGLFHVKTRDGLDYSVKIGDADPERYGRYARIDVAYEKPAPPSAPETPVVVTTNALATAKPGEAGPPVDPIKTWEEKTTAIAAMADAESKRLAPWTFVLLEGDCRKMTTPREQIMTVATTPPPPLTQNRSD